MTEEQRHKARILATIKANETRNANRVYKPEKQRRRHAVRRVRFDTYNIGEMMNGIRPR